MAAIDKLYKDKPKKQSTKQAEKAKLDETALLKEAKERSRDGAQYWKDNWEAAEDDLKFLSGEQWPSQVRTERELEQRPCLTNNVLPTFVDQILGDQRQNRPAIHVSAVDTVQVKNNETNEDEELTVESRTGETDYTLAECLSGIIRNIEYNCDAETAYDSAFEATVGGGFGYLRVLNDYVDEKSFEQELLIKHIDNQFSVTIDPSAKEVDKSDMNWCFIDDLMEKSVFEKKYPNATAQPVDGDDVSNTEGWFAEKTVRVSEYFTREPITKEVALMSDGKMYDMEELEPIVDELQEKGVTIERTRKVKSFEVYWRLITGLDVLEGPIKLNCTTIPVVPVWGKKITIKNKTVYRGAIRHSKDAQRMANYWDSAATESVALAPKAPFIGAEEHIEGHPEWKDANTKNYSVLTYTPLGPGDPGPRREQPAAVPAAEITLAMNSTDKIKATLGMFDASVGAQGNETSGRAILARQREADVGSFTFIDNLSKAIRRVGQLLVEMIPYVYDTERVMRLKFEDETEDYVVINEKILDEETGEWVTIHDLNVAKYDVVVKTGPAYSTQRQEAAEAMIQFAQAVPQAAAVMADLIAQNMDWPGADKITERLKKIMPPQVLTQKEREDMQEEQPEEQPPTPEQQLQMKELEVRDKEADAKMADAEAEAFKAQLESEQAQAEMAALDNQIAAGSDSAQQVKEMIAEAITEVMASM